MYLLQSSWIIPKNIIARDRYYPEIKKKKNPTINSNPLTSEKNGHPRSILFYSPLKCSIHKIRHSTTNTVTQFAELF